MRILIPGGKGFVGSALSSSLERSGFEVFPFSRSNGLDMRSLENTTKVISEIKPELIINCAAHVGSVHYGLKYPSLLFQENMQMVLNLFKSVSLQKNKIKMINLISNCVYPMSSEVQKEDQLWEGSPHPSALPYASTRRMILILSQCYYEEHGIHSKNLVLPGIFGPGNHLDVEKVHALDGIVIRMLESKRNEDSKFEIWGSGSPIREWCYIEDLVQIIESSISINFDNKPVNIGQNKGYSINETAQIAKDIIGFEGSLINNLEYEDGAAIKILDNKKFQEVFGEFAFTEFSKAMQNTIEFYKDLQS